MAVNAILVKGAKLYLSTDGGSSYSQLTDVMSMGEVGNAEAPDVDVTPLDETSNYREFLVGLLVSGDFTFEQSYTAARFTTLNNRLLVMSKWRITVPDLPTPSKVEFSATLKKCNLSAMGNADDHLKIACNMKLSGQPVFTPGS